MMMGMDGKEDVCLMIWAVRRGRGRGRAFEWLGRDASWYRAVQCRCLGNIGRSGHFAVM